ncbi:sigma-54 dependent transcriptional regulator [Sulfuritalea sp.]|uniref:sigma-54-dependent transcriptional regulator n=1 Tax=Sulfuritalea sp. TaxID=2480090 RepID=UPI00286EA735|nr:sigma-54 dependent transcriptional regulator [Sulfuritalea sp.]
MQHRIALIEDDPIIGEALSERLDFEGFTCDWFRDGKSARRGLGQRRYSVIVSDINLPDIGGEQLFRELLAGNRAIAPVIFITGYGAIDQAVRLLKLGAQDYVTKPFNVGELIAKIRGLCERLQPAANINARLGISTSMRHIEGLLPRLAASRSAVLISGESGVGKEEVARALHRAGDPEGKTPFIAVNCGAIPENLVESELFGHDKGAFTGADRDRRGVFEQADGGTLFLDEIGEMPPSMQVKLLRAIQDRAVVHVGGATPHQVDIRLICATHNDLKAMVEQGRFREDLYYRIHVIHLQVPPLRERQEDILWLAARLLDARTGRGEARRTLTPDAERALTRYPWPGNVRELQHCLERASVLSLTPALSAESLFGADGGVPADAETLRQPLSEHLQDCERAYIRRALAECDGRIADTAALLGISRKNLWEKMRKLDMAEG